MSKSYLIWILKTVEQDKAWYTERDFNTKEPKMTAQMFFTVYYAEKTVSRCCTIFKVR